ncbi:hypothetical protein MGYG_05894 [Nannizzia gypsea CBS 118893]|uniref:Uncharacterized protein n=1 Tax=Arthroderma gypseum (strain ATCC MYA-4604 / CBS 118893) TaxID=535722 RepID=E4UZV6_ARTGP|nr:hypothetical protein MGYG_05894 [Nannizzia gypsea CBS 118893]EFR02893.1 hypothetical protein MGYG_05894 [Nannizzia gypsea CBS 118893]
MPSDANSSPSEYISISDSDSLRVAVSEDIKSLGSSSPEDINSRDSHNSSPADPHRAMHRYLPTTVGPEELKDLIEDLVRPFRTHSTVMEAPASRLSPAAVDAALAPRPAPTSTPGIAGSGDAPAIDAEMPTVATPDLPGLAMSPPLSMMVHPSLEAATGASMVDTSFLDASIADKPVVSCDSRVVGGVSTAPSAGVSSAMATSIPAVSSASDTPSMLIASTSPRTVILDYIRSNTPQQLGATFLATTASTIAPIPAKSATPSLMPPPPVVSQCHKLAFGQPSALRSSVAPSLHSDTSPHTLFGQGIATSSVVSGTSRYSRPPETAVTPWGCQSSSHSPTVNSPPAPSLLVPHNQGMLSSFASPGPFSTRETSHAPGTTTTSFGQPLAPAGLTVPSPRELSLIKVLCDVNTAKLEDNNAMFYFGVICIQEHLAPSLEYLRYFDNKWVVRLKFGGHEVSKQQAYLTKAAATADACRGGLAILKGLMPLWVVPEPPELGVSPNQPRWNSLLACIPDPIYTQYSNFNGYRNEVEVAGLSFFGVEKCYPSIDEAIVGCAHKALHYLLITNGANGELMHGEAKPGALANTVVTAPSLPKKPEPVKVDLTKFPFIPSGGTAALSKRARKRAGKIRGKELALGEVTNTPKKAKGRETQGPQIPTAASATGANSVKVKTVEDTAGSGPGSKLVTPTFFNPSLKAQNPSTNSEVPNAAEFAQAIFFQCRITGSRSTFNKNPCTAREFRIKLKSYGNDLLRVKSICDRLSIHAPDFPVKVFNVKGSPMHFEVDAFFHKDAALRNFKRIGFTKHQSKPEAELLCHQNTVVFLMEVMMGVNQLQSGNWIEEAAMTDRTGFYL